MNHMTATTSPDSKTMALATPSIPLISNHFKASQSRSSSPRGAGSPVLYPAETPCSPLEFAVSLEFGAWNLEFLPPVSTSHAWSHLTNWMGGPPSPQKNGHYCLSFRKIRPRQNNLPRKFPQIRDWPKACCVKHRPATEMLLADRLLLSGQIEVACRAH